jgi:hypothetical protein
MATKTIKPDAEFIVGVVACNTAFQDLKYALGSETSRERTA